MRAEVGSLETGRFFGIRGCLAAGRGGVPPGNWEFLPFNNQKWENNSGVTTTQRCSVTMALFNKLAFRKLCKNKTQGRSETIDRIYVQNLFLC